MATSAFRSTRSRSSVPGGEYQRSRSLSRYSGRFPPPPPDTDEFPTPRGRFVNKTRGSGFPEISLDDLADEFFGTKTEEEEENRSGSVRTGRSSRRGGEARFLMDTDSSRQRGKSVSRNNQEQPAGEGKGTLVNSGMSRQQRRRSLSVAKYRNGDVEDEKNLYDGVPAQHERFVGEKDQFGNNRSSRPRRSGSVSRHHSTEMENDLDKFRDLSKLKNFDSKNFQQHSSNRQPNTAHGLRRSMSQKDISQSLDNYSSHSSSITDDEARDGHSYRSGTEQTISTIYTVKKAEHPTGDGDGPGLYETMRNEVRNAVQEIRTELEKVVGKKERSSFVNDEIKSPNSINVISEIRRNYTCKLEESEKRKQELLAELAAEEQRGEELTSIVRELLPSPIQIADQKRPLRPRRRSSDKTRMSECLIEEAERYFEDFLSNVEDTDISSFDGERSDTGSTLGASKKLRDPAVHTAMSETHAILEETAILPTESDGVLLPWLHWETSDDVNLSPSKSKEQLLETSAPEASIQFSSSTGRRSSFGSWSPEGDGSYSAVSSSQTGSKFGAGSYLINSSCCTAGGANGSSFDMEEYMQLQSVEDFLFERFAQRQRLESGSLVLCGRIP